MSEHGEGEMPSKAGPRFVLATGVATIIAAIIAIAAFAIQVADFKRTGEDQTQPSSIQREPMRSTEPSDDSPTPNRPPSPGATTDPVVAGRPGESADPSIDNGDPPIAADPVPYYQEKALTLGRIRECENTANVRLEFPGTVDYTSLWDIVFGKCNGPVLLKEYPQRTSVRVGSNASYRDCLNAASRSPLGGSPVVKIGMKFCTVTRHEGSEPLSVTAGCGV